MSRKDKIIHSVQTILIGFVLLGAIIKTSSENIFLFALNIFIVFLMFLYPFYRILLK
jgi:hypothetical protein